MRLELSYDDAMALAEALDRHLRNLEYELVRTEAPMLQHNLNANFQRLVALRARLGEELTGSSSVSAAAH